METTSESEKTSRKYGPEPKYPISELEPGETIDVLLKDFEDPNEQRIHRNRIYNSIKQICYQKNKTAKDRKYRARVDRFRLDIIYIECQEYNPNK